MNSPNCCFAFVAGSWVGVSRMVRVRNEVVRQRTGVEVDEQPQLLFCFCGRVLDWCLQDECLEFFLG